MARVKVWNDNTYDRTEQFKGKTIHIPAKKFIVMERDEATHFRGQFSPIKTNGDGVPLPESFKKIRLEPLNEEETVEVKVDDKRCPACDYKGASKEDLDEHVNANHLDQMVDEKEVKKRRKAAS